MAILAKSLSEYMLQNKYVDTTVQNGGVLSSGVLKVKGSIEHYSTMWEVIKDTEVNRRNLSLVRLDLTNTYGVLPHVLIVNVEALRYYNIPNEIIKY